MSYHLTSNIPTNNHHHHPTRVGRDTTGHTSHQPTSTTTSHIQMQEGRVTGRVTGSPPLAHHHHRPTTTLRSLACKCERDASPAHHHHRPTTTLRSLACKRERAASLAHHHHWPITTTGPSPPPAHHHHQPTTNPPPPTSAPSHANTRGTRHRPSTRPTTSTLSHDKSSMSFNLFIVLSTYYLNYRDGTSK
jgi:hypothetical protein